MSAEIICQGGFLPWICSNFPRQPIHAFLHSLLIISQSSIPCQLFERTFLKFFSGIFRRYFFSFFAIFLSRFIRRKRLFPLSSFFIPTHTRVHAILYCTRIRARCQVILPKLKQFCVFLRKIEQTYYENEKRRIFYAKTVH